MTQEPYNSMRIKGEMGKAYLLEVVKLKPEAQEMQCFNLKFYLINIK